MIPKNLKEAWEDNVWGKVIGGLILATILGFASYLFGFFPYVKSFIAFIYSILINTISVPIWFLILVSLPLIALAYITFLTISAKISRPNYFNYIEDKFYDLLWHWEWLSKREVGGKPKLTNLQARCPECNTLVSYHRHTNKPVRCPNHSCPFVWDPIVFDEKETFVIFEDERMLFESVRKQIDRKIYNKEW